MSWRTSPFKEGWLVALVQRDRQTLLAHSATNLDAHRDRGAGSDVDRDLCVDLKYTSNQRWSSTRIENLCWSGGRGP